MNVTVLGATGKTGQPLVEALAARGVRVRAAVRHPQDVPAAAGVEPVRFDWSDRATWPAALADTDALYVVGPYAHPDPAAVFAEFLAAAPAVRRVVLLTLIGAELLPAGVPLAPWEQTVRESGKEWTVLRPNWFQQNFGHGAFTAPLRDRGTLTFPAADVALSFVDTRDVAEVAAAALTEDGHHGRTYVLTGPEALTHAQAVAILGAAAGREFAYEAPSPQDFADGMRARGVPEPAVVWQLGLYELIRAGANTPPTDTVRRVTGHEPRSLSAYAAEYADRWRVPAVR